MVMVPLLALLTGGAMIGWASAPYDPRWQQRFPRRAAWMSLAGPAANFALVLAAGVLIHVGIAAGLLQAPERLSSMNLVEPVHAGLAEVAARFLSVLFSLNLLLGVFNLLPVPPLDGFSAIALLMPASMASRWDRFAHGIRSYGFVLLLVCWKLFDYIYWPVFSTGVHALYPSMYR